MDTSAYDTLLGLLNSAKLTLASNSGDLNAADLRIRCLVNITAKEAQRALLETGAHSRARRPSPAEGTTAVAAGISAHSGPPSTSSSL